MFKVAAAFRHRIRQLQRAAEQLRYSAPGKTIAADDLEALYQSVERGDVAMRGGEVPILIGAIGNSVTRQFVTSRDFEKLAKLKQDLSSHLANMAEAQEALRLFISRTFTIDVLLFLRR